MEIRRRPPNPKVRVAHLEYAVPHDDSEPRNILEKIVWAKDREVEAARQKVPLETLKQQISTPAAHAEASCSGSSRSSSVKPAVIAEVKKASPSKGCDSRGFRSRGHRPGVCRWWGELPCRFSPIKPFFKVASTYLIAVREAVELPLLCKEFILSPYQLFQARAAGADAVLLIAAILSDQDLLGISTKRPRLLGFDVLVEVHDAAELERVLCIGGFPLIGINNRDLTTFETDLATTERLTGFVG